jgi:hypothetical protein
MKRIAISYPISALFCVGYWLLWFNPQILKLFDSDGSEFLVVGTIALIAMAVQIILWSVSGIREKTFEIVGKWQSIASLCVVILFFCWGAYMYLGLYILGV